MNKLLTKIVNDKKLSKCVVGTGIALSILSNVVIFVGVYYSGLRKGVELMDEEEVVNAYEN